MFDEEPRLAVPKQPGLGADLSDLSVFELEERLALLREEIGRTETALNARQSSRAAADAVFGSQA